MPPRASGASRASTTASRDVTPPEPSKKAPPLRLVTDPPPLPTVEGGFKTILADPPWRFSNRTGKVAPEHRRLDRYSTLDLDAICELDVASIAAPAAHLYLWVPNALLPDGLRVMEAWGFRYISNIVWAKRRKDGGPDGRGVGFYFRNVTESSCSAFGAVCGPWPRPVAR